MKERTSSEHPATMDTMDTVHLYEFAVIRYLPRVEREEFINIGIIMMCKRRKWIRVKLRVDERKLEAFSSPCSAEEVCRQADLFTRIAEGGPAAGHFAGLPVEERFRWLTAEKSACLATSRPHPGITSDLDATFSRLVDDFL